MINLAVFNIYVKHRKLTQKQKTNMEQHHYTLLVNMVI